MTLDGLFWEEMRDRQDKSQLLVETVEKPHVYKGPRISRKAVDHGRLLKILNESLELTRHVLFRTDLRHGDKREWIDLQMKIIKISHQILRDAPSDSG